MRSIIVVIGQKAAMPVASVSTAGVCWLPLSGMAMAMFHSCILSRPSLGAAEEALPREEDANDYRAHMGSYRRAPKLRQIMK